MTLLSKEDCSRVEAAIARVESNSSTELVVAVVARCGEYWQGRVLVSFAWGLGTTFGILHLFPQVSLVVALLLQAPAALLAYGLFGIKQLWRLLIPPPQATLAVEERALALFSGRGVHRTKERTGMLILLSELERRVVILGDTGIHRGVGDQGWQAHVDAIVKAIHEGRAADGLVSVIEQLGKVHAELLPIAADDTNELPNEVLHFER